MFLTISPNTVAGREIARTARAARRIASVVLVCLAVCAGLLVTSAAPAAAYTGTPSDAEAQFAQMLNDYRNQNGLGSLNITPVLSDIARNWSAQMAASQTLSHDPDAVAEVSSVIPDWTRIGENVGYGYDTASLNDAFINSAPHRANMLGDYNQVGIGVALNGSQIWVTYRFVKGSIPVPPDTTPPSAVINPTPAATQSNSVFQVGWWGQDFGSGIQSFTVNVRDGSAPWAEWYSGIAPLYRSGADASGTGTFYGQPGHTYTFRVISRDFAGNWSSFSPEVTTTVSQSAAPASSAGRVYAANLYGDVSADSSPPLGGTPSWPFPALRGFVASPLGGGYAMDDYGGVYNVGGAPVLANTPYWRGWDIARGIALNADGKGGYVVDGWGGLHPIGNATGVSGSGYWPGWDIARGVVLLSSSTANNPAGYVFDAWGGLHPFGSAPYVTDGPYWPGWAMARAVATNPSGPGGWTLDGWGGVHAWGGAPSVSVSGYWVGWDIARGLAMYPSPSGPKGYVLDGWGGLHPLNGAANLDATRYWAGSDVARFLTIAP